MYILDYLTYLILGSTYIYIQDYQTYLILSSTYMYIQDYQRLRNGHIVTPPPPPPPKYPGAPNVPERGNPKYLDPKPASVVTDQHILFQLVEIALGP